MQASGSVCIKGPHESDISNQALRRHLILIFAKTYATVTKPLWHLGDMKLQDLELATRETGL